MNSRALLALLAAAGLLAFCFQRGRSAQASKSGVKEDLRRWEGEGGNVPAVATPSPQPGSYPGVNLEARH
jgi:hypothetical protein